jgi:hypothetical protein
MAEHDALASLNTCQADPALAQNDATASLQLSEDTAENNTTHATASSQNNAPYLKSQTVTVLCLVATFELVSF